MPTTTDLIQASTEADRQKQLRKKLLGLLKGIPGVVDLPASKSEAFFRQVKSALALESIDSKVMAELIDWVVANKPDSVAFKSHLEIVVRRCNGGGKTNCHICVTATDSCESPCS